MAEASKEWMDQYGVGAGGPSIYCQCGRTHVAIDSDDVTDDERAQYVALQGRQPSAFVLVEGVDCVTSTFFDGGEVVDGCECGLMARYEKFVSANRKEILAYFRAVADKAEREASELKAGMADIAV